MAYETRFNETSGLLPSSSHASFPAYTPPSTAARRRSTSAEYAARGSPAANRVFARSPATTCFSYYWHRVVHALGLSDSTSGMSCAWRCCTRNSCEVLKFTGGMLCILALVTVLHAGDGDGDGKPRLNGKSPSPSPPSPARKGTAVPVQLPALPPPALLPPLEPNISSNTIATNATAALSKASALLAAPPSASTATTPFKCVPKLRSISREDRCADGVNASACSTNAWAAWCIWSNNPKGWGRPAIAVVSGETSAVPLETSGERASTNASVAAAMVAAVVPAAVRARASVLTTFVDDHLSNPPSDANAVDDAAAVEPTPIDNDAAKRRRRVRRRMMMQRVG